MYKKTKQINSKALINPTVKELIEILQGMNPDAVVCILEFEHHEIISIEVCSEVKYCTYINDDGDCVKGDVVLFQ